MSSLQPWRLIPPLTATGRVQMALDRWLFQQHQQQLHLPTLRFYTWSTPTISLGCHQHHWPKFWQELTYQGQPLQLVKRPTGGRAVLHQGDLTYAIVTSGLPPNRKQAYRYLCEFLIQGWRSLEVELHYGQSGRGYIHHPDCFGTATDADLVMENGTKLIGSAQRWQGETVLQHGSIRLNPDRELFQTVFGQVTELPQFPQLEQDAGFTKVIEHLTQAAIDYFQIELVVQPLSEMEWHYIHQLLDTTSAIPTHF